MVICCLTGYAAAYYSYKWAEVLDDVTRFSKEELLILVLVEIFRKIGGNSLDDPKTLFHNFMGREPDPEALLIRSGLVGDVDFIKDTTANLV